MLIEFITEIGKKRINPLLHNVEKWPNIMQ